MFSSHLFPGMHLWYDFSGHTFQIAWYVQCKSEILFWYGIHTIVFAVLYFYTLGYFDQDVCVTVMYSIVVLG